MIEPILPVGGAMLLYGEAKVGKSYAALQLAQAVSRADQSGWMGFRTPRPAKVAYIQFDTPRSLWTSRLIDLAASGEDLSRIRFSDRELLCWPFDILDDYHKMRLMAELGDFGPDLTIIDTIREAHRGDENDSTDMQRAYSSLAAAVSPSALIVIAHGRKGNPDTGPNLINDNRGSNYLVGAVDAIVHFSTKRLSLVGRAVERVDLPIERLPSGFWKLA